MANANAAAYTTADIRNVALAGHANAGKTILVEALLHAAGAIPQIGSVEKGSTVSDFDAMEQAHQHSLSTSIISLHHNQRQINIVDTPGHPEFIGQVFSVLPAVETVIVVVNAQNGIETNTRRIMRWARQHDYCCLIVINKIDADDVDAEQIYAQLREEFGSQCLAINLPADGGSKVVDCFFNPEGESDFGSVSGAHTAIIDQTVEVDEQLMALYLEQGEVSPEQLHDPFEQALREGHLIPVCFTSAQSGAGINELLTVLITLMPNPAEGNPPAFVNGEGDDAEAVAVTPDADAHVLAHVFKITHDPFVGRMAIFRIHQGSIKKDSQLFIGDARKPIKASSLLALHGKEHLDVSAGVPGDIRALTKLDDMEFDAVLHDSHDEDMIHLASLDLPIPLVGLAIKPKSRGEEQKVAEAMQKVVMADPCLAVQRNAGTNETVLRGLGELHLRLALERMQKQYGVEVETSNPTIAYRETIMKKAEGHSRHKKQTGGAGQFGEVFLRVEPLPRGRGFEFKNEVVGGTIPAQFIPAVEKGVLQVLEHGAFAGFPMQDVRVALYDGKHHPVDSKEIAFVSAGKKAFMQAVANANPVVLEPVVDLEVSIPNSNMGDITGDLAARRGRVSHTEANGEFIRITGQVPLAEMEDYPSRLKSMTAGEGAYHIAFSAYETAPSDVQKRLSDAFQHPEDD